jgi:hypothetical protein
VEGSWPELFQMLKDGEIDLLSDVSYKPEREEFMSFPDLPMGSESYYIYVDAENRDISADDLSSFSGKRIGLLSVDEVRIDSTGSIGYLRRHNGDQTHQGRHARIGVGEWKLLHIRLYDY